MKNLTLYCGGRQIVYIILKLHTVGSGYHIMTGGNEALPRRGMNIRKLEGSEWEPA